MALAALARLPAGRGIGYRQVTDSIASICEIRGQLLVQGAMPPRIERNPALLIGRIVQERDHARGVRRQRLAFQRVADTPVYHLPERDHAAQLLPELGIGGLACLR
jgi:hypothetical protein